MNGDQKLPPRPKVKPVRSVMAAVVRDWSGRSELM
jgi:hypothetical protein